MKNSPEVRGEKKMEETGSNNSRTTRSSVSNQSPPLPRSIMVPKEDPRRYARETVDSIFSDRLMAFLALLLIPIIIGEFFFPRSTQIYDFLEICDWTIVALFIVEYVSKLYLADNRWAHFKSPWHLLDLVIITIPFLQFLPFIQFSNTGSAVLLLRLLRLPRVFAAAGRATSGRERTDVVTPAQTVETPATTIRKVDALTISKKVAPQTLGWDELDKELTDKSAEEWLDIYNISDEGFSRLSSMLQIAEPHFKSTMIDEIYPHVDYVRGTSFIFLQSGEIHYPETSSSYLTISKSGFILLCTGRKLISISRHDIDLLSRVTSSEDLKKFSTGRSFLVSVLYAVLDDLLDEYRGLLSEIELDIIQIGNVPRQKLPPDFLERIYQLTKEVSRLDSNLVHFKDMLGVIISRQVPLEGFDEEAEDSFKVLEDEASYLKEISEDLVDNLKSIIELYINQESFETNRILKILAVITSVAVIPAAVSGLLGMNLIGTPFQAHLWEIALMIGIAVTFALYSFIKLGWLKT